jgi:ADP-heptose:LPS heptosyltransferase
LALIIGAINVADADEVGGDSGIGHIIAAIRNYLVLFDAPGHAGLFHRHHSRIIRNTEFVNYRIISVVYLCIILIESIHVEIVVHAEIQEKLSVGK